MDVMDISPPETDRIITDFPLEEDAVRQRIVDFLGGRTPASATCIHLASCDSADPSRIERWPVTELDRLLHSGVGVARSLYDTRSVLVHLDIEYVNHDAPAEAFTNPRRAFRAQEPVVTKIEELLAGWGIRPLHLLTGQGHHFVWRFPRESELERRIAHLFPGVFPERGDQVFAHLGLLMDYFAFRIKAEVEAGADSELPVEITAIQVVPGAAGERELVSIDISEYGDPLASRTIRIPFTRYLKPWNSGLVRRLGLEKQIVPCVCLPLHEIDVERALRLREDPRAVAALAKRCCTLIPDEGEGTARLLEDYLGSATRAFHQRFYEAEHDSPELWPETYARTPLDDLPGCVRHTLQYPNDLLLKPAGMRLATRCLLAKGWHPRHIAGLFRSKFEDPSYGWMDCWDGYSPAFRADFYVRLFAGQIALGLDRLEDFHCHALREQGFCREGEPPCDVAPYREALTPGHRESRHTPELQPTRRDE